MTVRIVSDDTFEQEVLRVAEPVLVDFFAEWCAPCKAMAPALEQAAVELTGKVKIVKVDVDKSPAIKENYAILGMPTLLVLKGGKVVGRHTGAIVQKAKLLEWIASASAAADAPPEPRADEFKLVNGMHLVVIPSPRATSVVIKTHYKVGRADIGVGATLMQSLLSQLPDKSKPVVGRVTPDTTFFLQSVAKDGLRAAMQSDAARMAELSVTEEDLSEAKQKLVEYLVRNNAGYAFERDMWAALFGSHPYAKGRSGEPHEVSELSREELVRLHERHYAPNNAVVIVCGAVTAEEVKQLAEETYGKVPAYPDVSARSRPEFTLIEAGQRFMGTEPRVPKGVFLRRYIASSLANAPAGEAEALTILAQILNGSGRLSRPPVGDGRPDVIARAQYNSIVLGPGELHFMAMDRDPATTEAEFDQVIAALRTDGVTDAELATAKKRFTADDVIANYDEKSIAARYDAVACGIPISHIESRSAAIAKVTANDVRSVADKYLDPRRAVTAWLLPEAATLAKAG